MKPKKNKKTAAKANVKQAVHIVEYAISYDPVKQWHDGLPITLKPQLDALHDVVFIDPKQAIKELLPLKASYPKAPVLYNYLSAAYGALGDSKTSEALVVENYQQTPDYLFAKINYAQICINQGQFEQIPVIFNNKYNLKMLYPDRNIFHISEFESFTGVMCAYFCSIGDTKTARIFLDSLISTEPRSDMIAYAKRFFQPSLIQKMQRWLYKKRQKAIKATPEEKEERTDHHFEA